MSNWKRWNTTSKFFEVSTNNGSTWTAQERVITIAGFATSGAPAVSEAGKANLFYDTTLGTLRLSKNGGAYADLTMDLTTWRGATPATLDGSGYVKSVEQLKTGFSLLHDLVKSIQYGSCSFVTTGLTATATLSPTVVKANSILIYLGNDENNTDAANNLALGVRLEFTSNTTITANRQTGPNNGQTVNFCVVELASVGA